MINKKSSLYVLGFMFAVCIVLGCGVSILHNATVVMQKNNEMLHINRMICQAFDVNVSQGTSEAYAAFVSDHFEIKTMF